MARTTSKKSVRLENICAAKKNQNIMIWDRIKEIIAYISNILLSLVLCVIAQKINSKFSMLTIKFRYRLRILFDFQCTMFSTKQKLFFK